LGGRSVASEKEIGIKLTPMRKSAYPKTIEGQPLLDCPYH